MPRLLLDGPQSDWRNQLLSERLIHRMHIRRSSRSVNQKKNNVQLIVNHLARKDTRRFFVFRPAGETWAATDYLQMDLMSARRRPGRYRDLGKQPLRCGDNSGESPQPVLCFIDEDPVDLGLLLPTENSVSRFGSVLTLPSSAIAWWVINV
jgi:hypothetical protein